MASCRAVIALGEGTSTMVETTTGRISATLSVVASPADDMPLAGSGVEPTRILIVDPHVLVRWALVQLAACEPDLVTVGEAADADQALTIAFAARPHVVTLDGSMADGQVWNLARRLREGDDRLGIVIIVDDASDESLFRALDCGASALVSKTAPIREVLSAVRHAAASPDSFSAAGLGAALRRRRDTPKPAPLSTRELQIIVLLHDGLTVPQIAGQLFVSLSTAKTYVARVYDKLGARNRAQALMTAVRLGLFDAHTAGSRADQEPQRRSA